MGIFAIISTTVQTNSSPAKPAPPRIERTKVVFVILATVQYLPPPMEQCIISVCVCVFRGKGIVKWQIFFPHNLKPSRRTPHSGTHCGVEMCYPSRATTTRTTYRVSGNCNGKTDI